MRFGDKTIHIDTVDINTSQDTIEGYGVQTQPSKSLLGKFIADNLERRRQDKQLIIEALMEKPDDIPPHLEEKRAMLMAMAAQGVPLIHAPLNLQDTGLEGDEMNARLLLEGKDFNRNPTLDYHIPCKASSVTYENHGYEGDEMVVSVVNNRDPFVDCYVPAKLKPTETSTSEEIHIWNNTSIIGSTGMIRRIEYKQPLSYEMRQEAIKILKKIFTPQEHPFIENHIYTVETKLSDFCYMDSVIVPHIPALASCEQMHHSERDAAFLSAAIRGIYGIENFDLELTIPEVVKILKDIDTSNSSI